MIDATDRRRPLVWEGGSRKDFKEFPPEVQKDFGVALFVVQIGQTPPSAKPWRGLGSGVFELADEFFGNAYRTVYTIRIRDCVHVLHAFQKKSKSGIATPARDVELVESRFKALVARQRMRNG